MKRRELLKILAGTPMAAALPPLKAEDVERTKIVSLTRTYLPRAVREAPQTLTMALIAREAAVMLSRELGKEGFYSSSTVGKATPHLIADLELTNQDRTLPLEAFAELIIAPVLPAMVEKCRGHVLYSGGMHVPQGLDDAAAVTFNGITLCAMRYYNIPTDTMRTRFDVGVL